MCISNYCVATNKNRVDKRFLLVPDAADMDHYMLFKNSKEVTVKVDDMAVEKISRIFPN